MDSRQRLGVALITRLAALGITYVLFPPLESIASDLLWQSSQIPVGFVNDCALVACTYRLWLTLALVLIGHAVPIVIHLRRRQTYPLEAQLACSAAQVLGLLVLWACIASEMLRRLTPGC